MYAKLKNGTLKTAPRKVQYNNRIIFNPPESVLKVLGYYPVIYTDMPYAPEGQHAESSWEQVNDAIVQVWSFVDNPEVPEISTEPTMYDLADAIERGISV